MTVLKIYSLDDEEEVEAVCTLTEGVHHIGRGDILKCRDKRVSRNHLIIDVNKDGVTIKSTHVNPCFYRPNGGSIQALKINMTSPLNDNDQFALLADAFWFKVKVLKEPPDEPNNNDNVTEEIPTPDGSAKRKVEEGEPTSTSETKRQKSDVSDSTVENLDENVEQLEGSYFTNATLPVAATPSQEGDMAASSPAKDDGGAPSDVVADCPDVVDAGATVPDGEPKVEPTNDANGSSSSSTNTTRTAKRDRCWYGVTCYRRNPIHHQDFSHPGDNDYASDPEDDRSLCPFGAGCYNRNVGHRRQYKHNGPPAPKPTSSAPATKDDESSEDQSTPPPKKRKTQKSKRKAAQKKKYAETPEDDYDYDDPFLNDGSSDDFEISDDDDDDDEDWEDSQEAEVDSEETRRLMKEAKRFTTKK